MYALCLVWSGECEEDVEFLAVAITVKTKLV